MAEFDADVLAGTYDDLQSRLPETAIIVRVAHLEERLGGIAPMMEALRDAQDAGCVRPLDCWPLDGDGRRTEDVGASYDAFLALEVHPDFLPMMLMEDS